ncbi:hypothetical protein T440DRAFT_264386 [Plenodomus tracheiphilus IPT5]|uniref:Uncharacterized protein n=1 Tax=Plenodomus tracheiphilus IPT5 TaxID=1408161 RepID=A0A6A7AQN4_9PLEO|nr:hypothetical protein T440DRAFT_264386 [Plenodomus tracheiphilus IPT5]
MSTCVPRDTVAMVFGSAHLSTWHSVHDALVCSRPQARLNLKNAITNRLTVCIAGLTRVPCRACTSLNRGSVNPGAYPVLLCPTVLSEYNRGLKVEFPRTRSGLRSPPCAKDRDLAACFLGLCLSQPTRYCSSPAWVESASWMTPFGVEPWIGGIVMLGTLQSPRQSRSCTAWAIPVLAPRFVVVIFITPSGESLPSSRTQMQHMCLTIGCSSWDLRIVGTRAATMTGRNQSHTTMRARTIW